MFCPDNETIVDLLNFESISKTIINVVDSPFALPVSIGIHGDWGVGKSSILAMLEDHYKKDEKTLCIRFNGWLFQGFDDAKMTFLEEILENLKEKQSLFAKGKDKLISLHKRFNYIKGFKKTFAYGTALFTGVPNSEVFGDAAAIIKKIAGQEEEPKEGEEKDSKDDGWLSDSEKESLTTQIHKFRKEFAELLESSTIDRLIILIDDLDRCLPKTTIDILESMRLLLFVPKTAFIIAADEEMIEYCVKQHFPNLPVSSTVQNYTKNYLEKLIQIPFRLPALGELETESYLKLLFIERKLGLNCEQYRKLILKARESLKKPWEVSYILDFENDIKTTLNSDQIDDDLKDNLILAKQISRILAKGTKGNPRQLKRFLNSFFIRYSIAEASGYKSLIKENMLLKLMVLERFQSKAFDKLADEAMSNDKGISPTFTNLEKGDENVSLEPGWNEDWLLTWINIEPKLNDTDLRPYVFVSKDKKRFLVNTDEIISNLAEKISKGSKVTIRSLEPEIKALNPDQVQELFEHLSDTVIRESDFNTEPPAIIGIKELVKYHKTFQGKLVALLEELPTDKIGIWASTGWNNFITENEAKAKISRLLDAWEAGTNNSKLSTAIRAAKSVNNRRNN